MDKSSGNEYTREKRPGAFFLQTHSEDNKKRQITFAFSALHTLDELHLSFVPG